MGVDVLKKVIGSLVPRLTAGGFHAEGAIPQFYTFRGKGESPYLQLSNVL